MSDRSEQQCCSAIYPGDHLHPSLLQLYIQYTHTHTNIVTSERLGQMTREYFCLSQNRFRCFVLQYSLKLEFWNHCELQVATYMRTSATRMWVYLLELTFKKQTLVLKLIFEVWLCVIYDKEWKFKSLYKYHRPASCQATVSEMNGNTYRCFWSYIHNNSTRW